MKRYYISANNEKGFEEITEAEWYALHGNDEVRPYAKKVYRGDITLSDVPAELQAECESVVAARIERFGEYGTQPVTGTELQQMIDEVRA